jgi:hypothetical protein
MKRAGIKADLTWFFNGFKSFISNLALSFIVLFIIANAALITNLGILEYFVHNSSANYLKEEKGPSKTKPAIEGSLSACIKAVTAPIDLPHNPIVLTLFEFLK